MCMNIRYPHRIRMKPHKTSCLLQMREATIITSLMDVKVIVKVRTASHPM